MHPILLDIGGFTLHSYGLMVMMGFLVGILIARRRGKRLGLDPDAVLDVGLYSVLAGIVGARIAFLLWDYEGPDPDVNPILDLFAVWKGGLTFQGGLVLALAATTWYMVSRKVPVGKMADAYAPAVAVGVGVGRLGCFLNGCCWGKIVPHGFPYGATFPAHSGPSEYQKSVMENWPARWSNAVVDLGYLPETLPPLPVHPTQLYSVAGLLAIAAILLVGERLWRRRADGMVMAWFLLLYSVFRFGIEFWRDDTPLRWGTWLFPSGLRLGQWGAIVTFVAGAVLFFHLILNRKNEPSAASGDADINDE